MEIPIQVAVRLKPPNLDDSTQCVFSNPLTQTVVTESGQTFQINRALPVECSQAYVYSTILSSQMNCFLDGCDTSVVTCGQIASGKTYTLFGPGFECIHSQTDQGIIPRYLSDLFHKLVQMPERDYNIHLTWIQLVDGGIVDVLGSGLTRCSSVEEAFQCLQLGWRTQSPKSSHTVFTVSIEQKWIAANGMLNHRLSTASFCELSSCPDSSLYVLEHIIKTLADTNTNVPVNYDQSILSAMLRDSFGGRAFTWVICCLSTERNHIQDSIKTLEFGNYCRRIRNFVTVNGFADNNTPINFDKVTSDPSDNTFAMQFTAEQWVKLVSNAEGLFNKLLQTKALNDTDSNQISEWLFLKAEYDECLNTDNSMEEKENCTRQGLPRIAEDTEPSERSESDIESDGESSTNDDTVFKDKLNKYLQYFKDKNDEIISNRCDEYILTVENNDLADMSGSQSLPVMTSQSQSGRRRTVQPGDSLSGSELNLLRRAAAKAISPESQKIILNSHKNYEDPEPKLIQRELLKMIDSPMTGEQSKKYKMILEKYNQKQTLAQKLTREIDNSHSQLKELASICMSKEKIIDDLAKTICRNSSLRKYSRRISLKSEYETLKNELAVAQSKSNADSNNPKQILQVQKYRSIIDQYEKDMQVSECINSADHQTTKDIRKHENKLKNYRKTVEQIKRQIKKDEKRRNTLDLELLKDKIRLDEMQEGTSVDNKGRERKAISLKHVTSRISHIDNILKEKSSDLDQSDISSEKDLMLRKEITNLRKTRDCLLDQRCKLGNKRKIHKSLSDTEERKLLECEEAIEAIDTAIEYKNALICGRSPSESLDSQCFPPGDASRGEQMLMARLEKLSHDEMKTLLYKYFQKVVDLRGACAALEDAATSAAAETSMWRGRCAAAWRQHTRRNQPHLTHTQRYCHFLDTSTVGYGHSLQSTTESDTGDDTSHFVDRMRQLARYHQRGLPHPSLRQPPARTPALALTVTRQKNKLVILAEDKNNHNNKL